MMMMTTTTVVIMMSVTLKCRMTRCGVCSTSSFVSSSCCSAARCPVLFVFLIFLRFSIFASSSVMKIEKLWFSLDMSSVITWWWYGSSTIRHTWIGKNCVRKCSTASGRVLNGAGVDVVLVGADDYDSMIVMSMNMSMMMMMMMPYIRFQRQCDQCMQSLEHIQRVLLFIDMQPDDIYFSSSWWHRWIISHTALLTPHSISRLHSGISVIDMLLVLLAEDGQQTNVIVVEV